jgi:endonuclease YncB( thermonuclease family)
VVIRKLAIVLALLVSAGTASAATILIDGDTFVLDGERIRILEIDTPETRGATCENELILGLKAKQRLRELLDSGPLTIVRENKDYWGRTLAYVYAGEVNVGEALLKEGHALPYVKGKKARRTAQWCPTGS